MKRFNICLIILTVIWSSLVWAGGLEDFKAGFEMNKMGRYHDAVDRLSDALKSKDLDNETLASAAFTRAFALRSLGRFEEALADYEQALATDPDLGHDPYFYLARGNARIGAGKYDEAVADFSKAIDINPAISAAYDFRGVAHRKKGEYGKAVADHEKALGMNPDNWQIMRDYSWLLATCSDSKYRDPARALDMATKAFESHPNPFTAEAVAAACAQNQKFEDAVKYQETAISVLKAARIDALIPELELHLEAYKTGKPWLE